MSNTLAFNIGSNIGRNVGYNASGVSAFSELITSNADFETYVGTQDDATSDTFTGWTVNTPDGLVEATATAQSLLNAVKITTGATTGAGGARLTRSITVVPGVTYRLRFWSRGNGVTGAVWRLRDVTNGADIRALATTGITGTTYQEVIYDFVAPALCVSVSIQFFGANVDGSAGFYDNTSLKQLF